MRMKLCENKKCLRYEYHYILLTYSGGKHFENDVITTVCSHCYRSITFYTPKGYWYKIMTGGKNVKK